MMAKDSGAPSRQAMACAPDMHVILRSAPRSAQTAPLTLGAFCRSRRIHHGPAAHGVQPPPNPVEALFNRRFILAPTKADVDAINDDAAAMLPGQVHLLCRRQQRCEHGAGHGCRRHRTPPPHEPPCAAGAHLTDSSNLATINI